MQCLTEFLDIRSFKIKQCLPYVPAFYDVCWQLWNHQYDVIVYTIGSYVYEPIGHDLERGGPPLQLPRVEEMDMWLGDQGQKDHSIPPAHQLDGGAVQPEPQAGYPRRLRR